MFYAQIVIKHIKGRQIYSQDISDAPVMRLRALRRCSPPHKRSRGKYSARLKRGNRSSMSPTRSGIRLKSYSPNDHMC